MPITNEEAGTRIDEIADGIHRISTPIPPEVIPGGFTFNQYLIEDERPLLFHTGLRKQFPLVSEAIATVLPLESLRYVAFSHVEADECGSLNDFLRVAPEAVALCGRVAAMVSVHDLAERPPRDLGDGEEVELGKHVVRWIDTPHLPHGWESGFLFETTTRTLLCGDLFTRGGDRHDALIEDDILDASEDYRLGFDYYSHAPNTAELLEKLAKTEPTTLACMHGSAWRGDGAALLRNLATRIAPASN